MTAIIEITVESGKEEVTLQPIYVTETVELGVVESPDVVLISVDAGAPGPRGPRGASAQDPVEFDFPQAKSTWICPHNLNRYPTVTVVDGEGTTMLSGVIYDSKNVVRIEFGAPTVGRAFIV